MTTPPTPVARRLQRPSWRDTRLVVGVLLVLLSVLAGARLISSFDDSIPVYAAARPLLPGQEVVADDLVVVNVQLGDAVDDYVDGASGVAAGTFALRTVGAGELVPVAALGSAQQAQDKTVTVPVDPAAASTLTAGAVVDVWVSRRDEDAAGERYLDPELLLERAVVAQVPSAERGLGMGVGRTAVQVIVPAQEVPAIISSVDQEARVTLVPAPRGGGSTP